MVVGMVLSGNLVQFIVFWELASVFSFLLIGYWYHRKDARRGARMAFTVTGPAVVYAVHPPWASAWSVPGSSADAGVDARLSGKNSHSRHLHLDGTSGKRTYGSRPDSKCKVFLPPNISGGRS